MSSKKPWKRSTLRGDLEEDHSESGRMDFVILEI
jgi:hypothetical protein